MRKKVKKEHITRGEELTIKMTSENKKKKKEIAY